MRTITKAAAVFAMLAIPGAAFAAQAAPAPAAAKKSAAVKTADQPAAKPAAPAKKAAAVPQHTTAGVVKSVSDSSLVLTKGGKDQTFVVNASTEKKGPVEAGAHVAVHYTMDGKTMVATAITGEPAKPAKSKGKQ